jgi:DNA-binding response OmpR family regulator
LPVTAILILGSLVGASSAQWKSTYLVRRIADPNWHQVVRISNLFDVLLADHRTLGPAPATNIGRLARSGAPPLAVLTTETDEAEKIGMLEAGAAYCLPLSIGWKELSARIDALAARRVGLRPKALMIGEWIIDLSGKRLITPQLDIPSFTPGEFGLLELFVTSGERVLSRPFLLDRLGKLQEVFTERSIDVYVSRLRRKLLDLGANDMLRITATRNEGYRCVTGKPPLPLHRIPSVRGGVVGEASA